VLQEADNGMRENLSRGLDFVFKHEGYMSNHPKDPGKLTIWGIASAYWPDSVAAMQKMTQQEAKEFAGKLYLREFWIPTGCDSLPSPMDIAAFDTAVNTGVSRSVTFVNNSLSWRDVIFYRIQYYAGKKSPFLQGWINRCMDLWTLAKKLEEGKEAQK
jgi:lysozyme family protein